ncbi:hypothetical protein FB192DRAFT_1376252 [Mucor lusitanicus]|uniref:LysM domain-containing protein n=1 Tax=Mucor circinelloides f. lusitanicus TaxID=29924 RepID=A0A8H4F113_MUCCL|nr:hypothetical protein FB192DRAFT_1376252 [Mucor lusitanicus]
MKLLLLASSVLSVASLIQAADHYSHPCEETYNVVQADDCKSIAAAYGVTEAKLQQWNQYFDPNFQCNSLNAGDHVCVQVSFRYLCSQANRLTKASYNSSMKSCSRELLLMPTKRRRLDLTNQRSLLIRERRKALTRRHLPIKK